MKLAHSNRLLRSALLIGVAVCALAAATPSAKTAAPAPQKKELTDLDQLMEQALKRRDEGREVVRDYVLDELERVEALGPGRIPLYRVKREYEWYVREGLHVRSPVRFDGVKLSDEERKKQEDEWIANESAGRGGRGRNRRAGPDAPPAPAPPEPALPDATRPTLSTPIPEPRFVSDAYFLSFKFKPGNYYLAGREKFDGHDVLRVEYYPDTTISEPSKNKAADIDRRFDKTSLVTLWVDPAERQIVKFTFDNVWLDFLPASWMVHVSSIKATMLMTRPFNNVWLPSTMSVHAVLTLANGNFDLNYSREFSKYKLANVTLQIKPAAQGKDGEKGGEKK